MDNKKLDSKKKNKELMEQAAERLAEIIYMQIEWQRKQSKKRVAEDKPGKLSQNEF